jgi:outer membrane protein assembly factor BamB
VRYDAFISYRHGELDGLVAEKLHKMLEAYRIPRVIAKRIGKKKLTRVFRDREELPTSSNLSDSINDALENSSFLLLICSRRTCESQWVMREAERFGELRGKDCIITLLIDGEPDESFPPGLREREVGGEKIFVEPMAADIRADTWAGSLRLLKEEKLRLLAPVLGCAFDDLRRRHRRRRLQRTAAFVSAAFAFTLSFGSFSTYQYIQTDREMQLKLQNQSYALAEYSERELADGNPETAALLALEALPKDIDDPERPLVPAAERALSDALGVYDATDGFKPHKVAELPAAPGKLLISPGESHAVILYPFTLAVYDPESGQAAVKLPAVRSALSDAEFLSDTVVVFTGENGLTAYDIEKGTELWRGRSATEIAVSGDKSVVAAVYKEEGRATLYSPDGDELGEIDFNERAMRVPADDSFLNPRDTLFELNGDGGRLAVSFADGSLSVFDTVTNGEIPLFFPSGAIHFSGGFCRNLLAFAVTEKEPYYSAFLVFDAETGETIARYESDSSRFIPLAAEDGLYVAFEDQIMAVNAETGAVSHAVSAGGRVETFGKNENTFLICESSGPYRFDGPNTRVYQSGYACHFADISENYALTGSYDAKTVRILKHMDYSEKTLLTYDPSYHFSEAKINPVTGLAAFYSHNGLRLCDLRGNIVAEARFPDPLSVKDTQYDAQSGNVAVLYEDRLRLFSGADASLLLEKRGKPGTQSVFWTKFGVSVLEADGTVTLYDLATALPAVKASANPGADCALPIGGGLLTAENGRVFFDGNDIGSGKLTGADRIGGDSFAFAFSDGANGAVFTAEDGVLDRRFTFEAIGESEVYFTGGYVFISPTHGDATVCTLDGAFVRAFDENGFLAETEELGEYIAAGYVSSSSERYTLLLDSAAPETIASLPGFLGKTDDETLVLDSCGGLRTVKLLNIRELTDMAKEQLGGKTLTPDEKHKFNAE